MFHKPAFDIRQVKHLVWYIDRQGNYGGFPVSHIGLVRDTDEISYVDMAFVQEVGLTQPLFEQMVKYIFVITAGLEDAPRPLYFAVMQKDLTEMKVDYYTYPDHSIDLIFWQHLKDVPHVDLPKLRFKN
ncbi:MULTISPECIES: hypothetical protein [Lacticaseibacillus]|uniref:Uncharacterized protein n=3 Tax=Lacticaseibacillus TaxID=2759736 RepID=A0ABW4CFF6_9LACO|nr:MULTISPECIES: hypothetical protein [Lacticaseibacillus]